MTDDLARPAAFAHGTRLADLSASTEAAAKLVRLDTLDTPLAPAQA